MLYSFYSDIGSIINEIPLTMVDDSVTHKFSELYELRDNVNTCEIVSQNMMHITRAIMY